MNIKTNIRAGAGSQKRSTSTDSVSTSPSSVDSSKVVVVPVYTRCGV